MSNECSVSAHLHLRPEVTTKQVKKAMSKFFREKDLSFDDVDEYKPGESISFDFTVYGQGLWAAGQQAWGHRFCGHGNVPDEWRQ